MRKFFQLLKIPPHAKPIEDPEAIKKIYRKLRWQNLYGMITGYAIFYFVRKNFSMAMPVMLDELNYTKTDFGWILTVFSLLYGLGKFVNGVLADRLNARYFMAFGLLASGIVNIFFGMSSSLIFFGIFWLMNAWFQSMGMPPSVRLLTHWFSPTELGTKWGLQSTAHQIGGAGILILTGSYLIPNYGWRSAFYVPAAIAIVTAFWLIQKLRDNPQSVGLPSIEAYRKETHHDDPDDDKAVSFKEILFKHVLTNKYIWIVAIANCFVYVARMGIMDWAPTYLHEVRGSSLSVAGLKTAAFELAGIIGAIGAGWITDTLFKGRRGPLAAVSMFILALVLFVFIYLPTGHHWIETGLLIAAGILVYGPQLLVPVAAADFATKKAAATATGFTGYSGYIGAAISGVGTGFIADTWGWDAGMGFFAFCAFLGGLLFMLIWNKRSPRLDRIHNSK